MNKKDIKQSVLVLICIIITVLSVTLISNAVTTISSDITTGGNVGIGTTTPNWSLQSAGTEPVIGLTDTSAGVNDKHWLFQSLGGHLYIGTSTDDLSATSSYMTIDNNGNVGVGTLSPSASLHIGSGATSNSVDAQILIARDVDDSTAGNGHAFSDSSDITRTGSISYNSFDARISFEGSNDYGHYAGFQSAPEFGSSGTIDDIYEFYGKSTVSAGTTTRRHGLYIDNPDITAGTITTNYGIYVAAQTAGDTDYAIYTNGTEASYFGGSVQVNNNVTIGGSALYGWSGRAVMYADSTGIIRLADNTGADFSRLTFRTANNSSPGITIDDVNGFTLQSAAGTTVWNDGSTAASGVVSNRYLFGLAAPTLTATNASVSYTTASSFYIGGAPTASTNVTIGTPLSLNVAAGNSYFGGNVGVGTTTPATLFDVFSTATTTMTIDSNNAAKGSCLKLKDVDGGGYTYCYVLDGNISCSTNSCE